MNDAVFKLEAQVNALARAWLFLAAAADKAGLLSASFEQQLAASQWPELSEAQNAEAQKTVFWLLDQHRQAREKREQAPSQ